MVNKLKILALLTLGFLPIGLIAAPAATYADVQGSIQSGVDQASGNNSAGTDPASTLADTIKTILNVLSSVAGVAAVIMIVVAGFRFVVGAGSESSVKAAKGAIVYAVIGIIIVALAQLIVHFVIANVTSTSTGTGKGSPTTSTGTAPKPTGYQEGANNGLH